MADLRLSIAVCLSAAALLTETAQAAATALPVEANGIPANRISMVYVSEGFRSAEMPAFAATVDKAVRYRDTAAMAEPYRRYRHFFNSYRIELPSPVSGITHPGEPAKNTPLNGQADSDRLGTVDAGKLTAAVQAGMAGLGAKKTWHYAVLNDPGYFNSGGSNTCVFSMNYWGEIALHEGGHAFHNLADEYGGTGTAPAGEPREVNVTADPAGKKWSAWVGYNQPGVGENKPFEGGRYFDKGIYRPSQNSKMNITSQGRPAAYNIISIEKILQDIYAVVKPLDAFRDTALVLDDPDSLWVKTVDPQVLWVDWSVDGKLQNTNGGEALRLGSLSDLAPGAHRIKAHAYDEVVLHSGSGNATPHPLDWARSGLAALQQDVEWTVRITRPLALLNPIAPVWKRGKLENGSGMGIIYSGSRGADKAYSADGRTLLNLP